ncbi:LysR family transcriptional regulator [Pseudomonas sp. BGr12]|uniref:LysR family transcriptional regulator n=1 Tax=unclassified Pseudomonas TaxID=196821 RepID=UPI0009DA90C1|nr:MULTISPECIES: LysR family transcriptional regulator [unclassified Pseudomonas]MBD9577626.1 LysR family transcriptional regulator [Pseudomonas sp. PDM23]MBD9672186.1 LysR family transcriptional regulator [Pseudomonas sp. PDM21]MDL2430868.1 LysR family transcriptional regulator [Pseudomonas sp. BJa5]OQR32906.1 LysR family transcriptional regulator [Pseudomonas sp. T]
MRFSLEQLQVFVTAVQAGSFSAAARRLGRTQSTVSAAIANLETDLGVELFDRSSRIPALTAAGRKLLLQAEAVLERCYALEGSADSLAEQVEPSLTLAIEVPYGSLIPVLREFDAAFPFVDLLIRHPVHGDVSELVLKGEADLGVAFSQPEYPQELAFQQLGKLIMAHVCHAQFALAQRERVGFADLHAHRRLAFVAHAHKLPSSEYLRAAQVWQAESYLALVEMVRAGLGWATLPRQLIQRELAAGELVELQLEAYPHTDWLVGVDLLWQRRRQPGKAERWLRECLQRSKVFELDRRGVSTTL